MKKPTQETIKKIDYIIQGLEDGRFTEISKAVEFHQKLKGDDEPTYFTDLLDELQLVRQDMLDLQMRINSLEDYGMKQRVDDIEAMLVDYQRNMRGIANGLLILAKPDPFDQDYTSAPNKHDAEQFVNDWKAKY